MFRPAADYPATLERWKALKQAASRTIVENHGTISHQHGVGKDHAPYLPREKGELAMAALHSLSRHFDPAGRLNPGTLLED